MLSRNESLSITTVQSELALSLFNEIPELKIRSFSYLKGIIAKESTFLFDSLQICETTGAIAAPDLPARFAIMIIEEYSEISLLILDSDFCVNPLIR